MSIVTMLVVCVGFASCSKEDSLNEVLDDSNQQAQIHHAPTKSSESSQITLFIASYYDDDYYGWDGGDVGVQVSTWYEGVKQNEWNTLVGSGYEIGYVGINIDRNISTCGEIRISWSSNAKTWALVDGPDYMSGPIIKSGYNPGGSGSFSIYFCEGDYAVNGLSLVLHYN